MKSTLYRLRIPLDVAELIRGLHPQIKRKLRGALEQIFVEPRSGKALKDEFAGLWSFRVGKFRLIYRMGERRLDLVAFGPRERVYEETYRLVARTTKKVEFIVAARLCTERSARPYRPFPAIFRTLTSHPSGRTCGSSW